VREEKGIKGSERVVGEAAGGECVFMPGERTGLADEVGSDTPYRYTAGREVVTGPLNWDGVIHRFLLL
jgi:hypothetical protein